MERSESFREERRKYPRYDLAPEITYAYGFYSEPIKAKTLELSLGGARIQTDVPLLTGESLEVSISIDDEEIDLTAKVIHTYQASKDTFIVGLSFDGISEIKKKVLGHFFQDHAGDSTRDSL